jgi:hypothetical protein
MECLGKAAWRPAFEAAQSHQTVESLGIKPILGALAAKLP